MTATTVKLGVEYVSATALAAYAGAAGAKGAGSIDQLQAFKAAVAAVNRSGGVAGGRRIVIVARERHATESVSVEAQKSCAAFTQDDHVFAANAALTQDNPTVTCLAKAGALSVGTGYPEAGSQHDFVRFGGRYLAPGISDTVTAARTYVDALVRQGLLTPRSKVGLLWFDFHDFQQARTEGLLPALKAHGIAVKADFRATYGGTPTDLGPIATDMQSAVLRFRSAGVDRVINLDYNGTLEYFFMLNAEQQGYRPKYGLSSFSDAEFLRSNVPATQLAGSTGIGWNPTQDVPVRSQPDTPASRRCQTAMHDAGLPSPATQSDVVAADMACGTVFFLATLLNTAADLTPAGLRSAAEGLGRQPSSFGLADSYGPGKFWGAASYRDLNYVASCSCFAYMGPNRSL